jgi:phosphoglycerate-specific signal transduction histidine kinase
LSELRLIEFNRGYGGRIHKSNSKLKKRVKHRKEEGKSRGVAVTEKLQERARRQSLHDLKKVWLIQSTRLLIIDKKHDKSKLFVKPMMVK